MTLTADRFHAAPRTFGLLFALVAVAAATQLSCQRSGSSTKAVAALPGAPAYDKALQDKLAAAVAAKGKDYVPRTRHTNPDGSAKYTNRLALEASPYLQQHAHNPVNWFPWGDEAFELAKKLDRPVLLSVGYSTCHWCHVMEEESFEDEQIATRLNEGFIAIKVDREERPDIDSLYMSAAHAMKQQGGWPLNVFLTAERKPFFAGTYFPPYQGSRRTPAFYDVLASISKVYDEDRRKIMESGEKLARRMRQMAPVPTAGTVALEPLLTAAAKFYVAKFDNVDGGLLSKKSKFPTTLPIRFLLREHYRTGDQRLLEMAALTLTKMAGGGMYDQVGGGFHRYSVDPRWLVPHFEKMLYDQAKVVPAYLDGYVATKNPRFAEIVRDVLTYLAREMTAPSGAFYSATDADSKTPDGHLEEGAYFTWTVDELRAALSAAKLDDKAIGFVLDLWSVTVGGNFEGRSVLHRPRPLAEVAAEHGMSAPDAEKLLDIVRIALRARRDKRPLPLRDEKILSGWNGLTIAAFAMAGRVLGEPDYIARATKSADFVLANMRDPKSGRLYRAEKDGRPYGAAYAEDYAFLIRGLCELFEATAEPRWLREAIALDKLLLTHFQHESGALYLTADDHEQMIRREIPNRDGAIPTGNSVHAHNLVRLYEWTTDETYLSRANNMIGAFAAVFQKQPTRLYEMLLAVHFLAGTPKQIVLVGKDDRAALAPLSKVIADHFVPNSVVVATTETAIPQLSKLVPLVGSKMALRGETTAYVCEGRKCDLPTSDPAVLAKQLSKPPERPAPAPPPDRTKPSN